MCFSLRYLCANGTKFRNACVVGHVANCNLNESEASHAETQGTQRNVASDWSALSLLIREDTVSYPSGRLRQIPLPPPPSNRVTEL
jgi:hypothetical protein